MSRLLSPQRLAQLLGDFPRTPAYLGLLQSLRECIGDGRIPLDTRLPSERLLAQTLRVSRNTVTRAYGELIGSGFAVARQGSGTYASAPAEHRRAHDRALLPGDGARPGLIDLGCAASAATPGIAAAYARALEALPAYLGSDGYLPSGLPRLQAALAASFQQRGLPTTPEQIIITPGALAGIALVARALTGPGDCISVDVPGYPNAFGALRLGGARLLPLPLLETGWDLDEIAANLRRARPRLAYLIPDFHNPNGLLMEPATRQRYAAVLREVGGVALVDETLQPTALTGRTVPPPFATFAGDAITVGSASKIFWGGLRIGWIRAPLDLVPRLLATRVQMDLGCCLLEQLVLAELLARPDSMRERRQVLLQQRDALAQALREHLPDWRFQLPEGGLSLWLHLPHGSSTRLAAALEPAGVNLAPGPLFGAEGGFDNCLRLPYARPAHELVDAVQRIALAWQSLPQDAPARSGRRPRLVA
jgi:DNA-binding transcriptional MocR family regulator